LKFEHLVGTISMIYKCLLLMNQYPPERTIEDIRNEKFLTLIIKIDGKCSIGNNSINDRNTQFNMYDAEVSWSAINYFGESITVIYKDDYRISKDNQDNTDQKKFWGENKDLFNHLASRIANYFDQIHTNCILGTCAFIFDEPTNITDDMLQKLVEKYKKII